MSLQRTFVAIYRRRKIDLASTGFVSIEGNKQPLISGLALDKRAQIREYNTKVNMQIQ